MSLIPSESHSFPDDFSRNINRARVLNELQSAIPKPLAPQRAKPAEPLPKKPTPPAPLQMPAAPEPRASRPAPTVPEPRAPVPAAIEPRALSPARAPKPIPIVPRNGTAKKFVANGNGSAAVSHRKRFGPARGSAPVHVDLARNGANRVASARPTTARPIPDARSYRHQMAANAALRLKEDRRRRLTRFLLLELISLFVLICAASLTVSHELTDSTLRLLTNILTMIAAAAVAIVPIIFFAVLPALPRDPR